MARDHTGQAAGSRKSGGIERIGKVAADGTFNVDERIGADSCTRGRAGCEIDRDRSGRIAVNRTIVAQTAVQMVITGTAGQVIPSIAAIERVVAIAAEKNVVTCAAAYRVVSGKAAQGVVAIEAFNDVVAACTGYDIGADRSDLRTVGVAGNHQQDRIRQRLASIIVEDRLQL